MGRHAWKRLSSVLLVAAFWAGLGGCGSDCSTGTTCRSLDVIRWCLATQGACTMEWVVSGCAEGLPCSHVYFPAQQVWLGYQPPPQRLTVDLTKLPANAVAMGRLGVSVHSGAPLHLAPIQISFLGAQPTCTTDAQELMLTLNCDRPSDTTAVVIQRDAGSPGDIFEALDVYVRVSESKCTQRTTVCGR